jgi:hypothetical protein
MSVQAKAQVVPAYTQTNTYVISPSGFQPGRDYHVGAIPLSSVNSDAASGTWGSLSAYSFADLSTGVLKSQTTLVNSQVGSNLYVQSNAYFGDGFRTANPNGSPYTWGPSSSGRFTLNLTGSITSSSSLQSLTSGAFVILSIYRPFTLNVDQPAAGVPEVLAYYYWQLGNPNLFLQTCDYNGVGCFQLTPTAYLGTFPQTIVQNINPGSDFDWSLLIGSYGSPGDVLGSFDMDFSHTLNASYQGPVGTTTYSQSGVFPSTLPVPPISSVPEPTTVALLGVGLGVLGLMRRSRGKGTRVVEQRGQAAM